MGNCRRKVDTVFPQGCRSGLWGKSYHQRSTTEIFLLRYSV